MCIKQTHIFKCFFNFFVYYIYNMQSSINTDIFFKAHKTKDINKNILYNMPEKNKSNNAEDMTISINSSLFKSNFETDDVGIEEKLSKIHNVLLDTEYIPSKNSINSVQTKQSGGKESRSKELSGKELSSKKSGSKKSGSKKSGNKQKVFPITLTTTDGLVETSSNSTKTYLIRNKKPINYSDTSFFSFDTNTNTDTSINVLKYDENESSTYTSVNSRSITQSSTKLN
jgi:hypothetical protein